MSNMKALCVMVIKLCAVGWLVVLINVDLAIFQPYLDLEAGDNQSLKIQVARRGKSYVQSFSFLNVGQRSRDQNLWYHRKGLVIRNTLAKYESPISEGKKVIGKPKV